MPIRRVGRPGLLGTVGRTAVIAGTATAVSNKVSNRQAGKQQDRAAAEQQQWAQEQLAQQQAAPAPAAPAAPAGGIDPALIDQLKELGALRDQGILTEDEFAAQKAKLLG